MCNDVCEEILEWEARHVAAITKRLFKTGKIYKNPRKEKMNEHRRHYRKRTDFSDIKKVLKRVRNSKIRHLPVDAEGLVTQCVVRKTAISFDWWL
jgi:hypothetical protein